jgi:Calx-beta domain
VNVRLFQDSEVEGPEFVSLTLSSPSIGTALGHSQGVGEILDSTSPSQLNVYAGDVTSYERDTGIAAKVKVPIALSAPAPGPVTVEYTISSVDADGADYFVRKVTGVLKFPLGAQVKYLTVSVVPDSNTEPDESVQITLSNPSGVTTMRVGTLTIANDD